MGTADKTGPKHINKELTRDNFEKLCENLIERCKIPVEKALNDARVNSLDIDEVVLVGGSTRIPAIQTLVKSLTNTEPNKSVNPGEVVAIGAAIQAGILVDEIKDVLLLDVTPLSLGVETLGGVMTKVISRNTTIPIKKGETFSTAVDNQANVEIHVLQGERELVDGNKSLGNFRLDGIPEAPRGVPQIKVKFDIDVDGRLSVQAKEKETGIQQSVTIQGASTLNKDEVEKMLNDAEKYASVDKERRKDVDKGNEAMTLCFELEKEFSISKDELTDEKQKNIEELIQTIKQDIQNQNYKSLESQTKDLKQTLKEIRELKLSKEKEDGEN